jgi:hypothetical protein
MAYDTIKLRSPQVNIETVEAVLHAMRLRAYPRYEKSAIDLVQIEVESPSKALPIFAD